MKNPLKQYRTDFDLELSDPLASFDVSRKDGVMNIRLQNEVKDTLDVALRSVRRQAFQQDGARHARRSWRCLRISCGEEPSMRQPYPSQRRERVRAH